MQVLLVAGDTFRAAAAEQLAGWAERSKAEIAVASNQKQRPDALMYSAIDRVWASLCTSLCTFEVCMFNESAMSV